MRNFKSIFFKFVASFFLIIVICFAAMSFAVSSILTSYGTEIKAKSLATSAGSLFTYIKSDFNDKGDYDGLGEYLFTNIRENADYQRKLSEMMKLFSGNDGEIVFLIADDNGLVLMCGGSGGTKISEVANSSFVKDESGEKNTAKYYYIPDEIQKKLEEGKTFVKVDSPHDMYGFFKSDYMYYIFPVYNGGEFTGSILAASKSYGETDAVVSEMNKTVITSALWILLATFVIIYFVTNRFISPIREMSRAAKAFAKGQFDVRVTVSGDDEIAELATAFNNMASSMQTMEDMRRSFLANVSHDLRTPMTTISGFIDGILDGAIPPEKHEYYLGIIASEVRRLSRLVSQLLDISRLEAGERKFNPEIYDICEQGREIIIANVQRLEEKNLDVRFECDRDNMYVFADKDAVHQIFYNICDNAIKFSREGGVYEIKITEKDDKLYVSVYNEGQGIPKEDLPNVFERFYKSDKSRGMDKRGVGLGMYIARTIIEAQGEKIWVESEEGEWCRFTFTLKAVKQKKNGEGKGGRKE